MWNGSYKDSKYKETDNLVNDVLENDGTLTHEETSDGYTHETKDRGSYISDDYYFPNDKGKHDHYELRSSGEVLKNGKPI
ncbi:MAG: hypothetical protein IIY11_08225 [Clostridia bacterium]|nr:hypothetical protein [Clostridia bacterium]MBQ2327396.1 hypothetical protein [Clostridia bacterium]